MKAIDLTGQHFGRWTVLSLNQEFSQEKGYRCYNVRCSCGNEKVVRGSVLKSGKSKSCGCYHKERISQIGKNNFHDLTGQKFNLLTALKFDDKTSKQNNATYWFFQCECGNIKSIRAANVLTNSVKSCGCLKTSMGEYQIQKILEDNNINYQKEYIFSDFKSPKGEFFRYDFAIFNKNNSLKYLIEFQGKQHFKPSSFFDQKISFELRQQYDLLKQQYCQNKNIPLILINYDEEITPDKVIKEEWLCL